VLLCYVCCACAPLQQQPMSQQAKTRLKMKEKPVYLRVLLESNIVSACRWDAAPNIV